MPHLQEKEGAFVAGRGQTRVLADSDLASIEPLEVIMKRRLYKHILPLATTAVCGSLLGLGLHFPVYGQVKPRDTVILKGAPMGGVKFEHKLHVERAASKCETCHHPSKPEKPAKAAQQTCTDCHTKPVQAGMKTALQAAFHNSTAQSGTCIDCHKQENAKGKKAPSRCADCHKKDNV